MSGVGTTGGTSKGKSLIVKEKNGVVYKNATSAKTKYPEVKERSIGNPFGGVSWGDQNTTRRGDWIGILKIFMLPLKTKKKRFLMVVQNEPV